MLNLIQTNASDRQRIEMQIAVAVGLCMGLGLLLHTELSAQSALDQAQIEALIQEKIQEQIQVKGLRDKRKDAVFQSDTPSLNLSQERQDLEAGASRLNLLALRQTLRDDVTAVQTDWGWRQFLQSGQSGQGQPRLKLKVQQWQQGRFTWEGLAEQPQDLDHMVHALHQLNRWSQAPAVVQLQSAAQEENLLARKGLVFVLQGDVPMTSAKGP